MIRSGLCQANTLRAFLLAGSVLVASLGSMMPVLLAEEPAVLPGTKPLTAKGDLSAQMRVGIDRFITREAEKGARERSQYWKRDFASVEAYARSIAPNRERLRRMIGLVDARVSFTAPELIATTTAPALIAEAETFRVFAIRWPVLDGIFGEGLFLQPKEESKACVVALSDADQTPEQLAGLSAGLPPEAQIARKLAASGCQVVVPVLIDRSCEHSGHPDVWMTNQPHPNSKAGHEPDAKVLDGIVQAQRQAQPFVYRDGLIEIPMSPISDIAAFRTGRWKLEWYLKALRLALEWVLDNGAVFDFLAHPSCLYVMDPEFKAIETICAMTRKAGDRAGLVDLRDIADSLRTTP